MKISGNYLKDQHTLIWSNFLVKNFATFTYIGGLTMLFYVDWRVGIGAVLLTTGFGINYGK